MSVHKSAAAPRQFTARYPLVPAIPATLIVFLALPVLRWVAGVPTPLLILVGVLFSLWSPLFWLGQRLLAQGRPPAVGLWPVAAFLAGGLAILALLLGGVYRLDRGGWLWFRLTGYETVIRADLSHLVTQSPEQFIARHPAFHLDPADSFRLVLPAGDYIVAETIIVPHGVALTIEPGTTLRFAAGRSLVAYGPVIARGTAAQPILFTARSPWLKWGAVGVVEAGPSVFEHVRFEHGRLAAVNGLDLLGALTLINSEAEIRHSQFVHLFGKDGVYVDRGRVWVEDSFFGPAYRDGLDLDGAAGQIRNNRFVDCGDEGLDLSLNESVEVVGNVILDSHGGRISADRNLAGIMSANTLGFSSER